MYISTGRSSALGETAFGRRSSSPRVEPIMTFASLDSYVEWCEANGIEADPAVVETCLRSSIDQSS